MSRNKELTKYRKDHGLCYDCDSLPEVGKTRCRIHLDICNKYKQNYMNKARGKVNQRLRDSRKAWKQLALDHYGRECQCCNENEEIFLSIDHIENNGAEHRRTVSGARDLYQWLNRNKFPPGFQTLCRNCNWAKYINGICPHQLCKKHL